ncbi:p21-C-terminal region-binding protein-domain-containing protein [Clohesyomyces aquaticus]|uniref:Protein BCP1 n=1 Tax=Clohesyomyces aquaticus TaxID=1231657 RepID=A0A1Y2A2Z3_9PLEO|nr:p21-C-terminal region-binding protein-domain-containing protein [Clohesyomyces aquaticus]
MPKRKPRKDPEDLPDAPESKGKRKNDDSDSDEDMDMVNVDFEWFDPQPSVDFHGLKTLLRQLLDVDAQLFDLSALADLILSQPLLGSTVKVDGNESDPYAFLTVLNLSTHKDNKVVQDLTAYLQKKASVQNSLKPLATLLDSESTAQVGLILTERFLNMPHETIPPMYTMLLEEIAWALEEKEPYSFTHYLILSKTYTEIASALPAVEAPPTKKKKGGSGVKEEETFYFHPEDEVLQRHALASGSYEYDTPVDEGASDAKRAFQELGVRPKGHLVLIEGAKFEGAVAAVKEFLGGGQ